MLSSIFNLSVVAVGPSDEDVFTITLTLGEETGSIEVSHEILRHSDFMNGLFEFDQLKKPASLTSLKPGSNFFYQGHNYAPNYNLDFLKY